MALRNVVREGDEVLRKKTRTVEQVDDRIRMILDDMLETMRSEDGVGLAAPQVGILKRMFVVEVEGEIIYMVNPEFVETEGVQKEEEGCLSVPGVVGTVERPAYVKMKGLGRDGEEVVCEGTGLLARALCHEYDHLDGVLFTDKAIEVRDADYDAEVEE